MSTEKPISNDSIKKENAEKSKKELIIKHENDEKKISENPVQSQDKAILGKIDDTNEMKKQSEKEETKEIPKESEKKMKREESYEALKNKVKNLKEKLEKKEIETKKIIAEKDEEIKYLRNLLKNKFGVDPSFNNEKIGKKPDDNLK